MNYSIDTSAILHAWRRAYPPEVFPALWEKLNELVDRGELLASQEVLFELERKDDDVYRWARGRRRMFVPTDEDVQRVVQDILRDYPGLVDPKRERSGADPFVVAVALESPNLSDLICCITPTPFPPSAQFPAAVLPAKVAMLHSIHASIIGATKGKWWTL